MESTGRQKKSSCPSIAAVVLTWNDTELAAGCIASVLGSDRPPDEVLVVDNGSDRPCGRELAKRFPTVKVVELERNQGFTGGANRGLEAALASGADYVLFLNNDTVLAGEAIGRLVAAMEERQDVAAASALLLNPGGNRVQFYTGKVTRDAAFHSHPEQGSAYFGREWPTVETEFAPACAILFRADSLRAVGLFDEGLGTNWEDYDLCLRFLRSGWKMLTVGSAKVEHVHGATTGRVSPYITYYFTRNRLICLLRHGRPLGIIRRMPLILRSFWWQVKAHGLANWACNRAFLRGILDFLLGVRGVGHPPVQRADSTK